MNNEVEEEYNKLCELFEQDNNANNYLFIKSKYISNLFYNFIKIKE